MAKGCHGRDARWRSVKGMGVGSACRFGSAANRGWEVSRPPGRIPAPAARGRLRETQLWQLKGGSRGVRAWGDATGRNARLTLRREISGWQ